MFNIIKKFLNYDIISHGEFTLKSGKKSNIYVDLKKMISYPDLISDICNHIDNKLINNYDYVLGVPYGGICFANYISIKKGIPGLILRKEVKDYGKCNLIEGNLHLYNNEHEGIHRNKILLIEDVVTTGNSVKEVTELLISKGFHVDVISIVDRSNGNVNSNFLGVNYNYVIKIPVNEIEGCNKNDMFTKLIKSNIYDKLLKKSKICLSADYDSLDDVIKNAELLGDHFSIIKLHIDTYPDFTIDKINKLKKLSIEKNFLIWEDRKFADIGNIMYKQITGGIYNISKWADIITIHGISGKESIKILDNIGCMIFLVSELSASNNLIDETYTNNCLKIADSIDSVVGCVCQNNITSKYIKVVPGISNTKIKDNMGQLYSEPSDKNFADFFVIGRSINNNSNPLKIIKEFKKNFN